MSATDSQVLEGHRGEAHGSHENRLRTYDVAHFTIDGEDTPNFHCRGTVTPKNVNIPGFTNPSAMHLAAFMAVDTNGEANMVSTQSKTYSFHFQLK